MTSTRDVLDRLAAGEITTEEAEKELKSLALTKVGDFGMLDSNRQERSGVPEVVYAESKTVKSLVKIVDALVEKNGVVLITRMTQQKLEGLQQAHPKLSFESKGSEEHLTVFAYSDSWSEPKKEGKIAILTAGTSDVVYARETEAIARLMGVETVSFYDVGVAGIHRLIEPIQTIVEEDADAVVVLAGMEGALPTVVAALIDAPVIGVPIPTGYGHGGMGETALASMLQSCSPGLAVVNIGNGLGAGSVAALIAKRRAQKGK
ncbi:MAG: nickel pincer cofactor biosynthesis protein LarB [Candidatus Thorarchaeota archaeon]